jgi:hypothetical protein
MGSRGPVPKRDDQRRNRNTPKADKLPAEDVTIPATPRDWHPLAKEMFNSLKVSGQRALYAQSDWAFAKVTCARMSQLLFEGSTSGSAWGPVDAALARLLTTEGDRRRLRLELQRSPEQQAGPNPTGGPRRLKAVDVQAS